MTLSAARQYYSAFGGNLSQLAAALPIQKIRNTKLRHLMVQYVAAGKFQKEVALELRKILKGTDPKVGTCKCQGCKGD